MQSCEFCQLNTHALAKHKLCFRQAYMQIELREVTRKMKKKKKDNDETKLRDLAVPYGSKFCEIS